jgi:hypothetical protein
MHMLLPRTYEQVLLEVLLPQPQQHAAINAVVHELLLVLAHAQEGHEIRHITDCGRAVQWGQWNGVHPYQDGGVCKDQSNTN